MPGSIGAAVSDFASYQLVKRHHLLYLVHQLAAAVNLAPKRFGSLLDTLDFPLGPRAGHYCFLLAVK